MAEVDAQADSFLSLVFWADTDLPPVYVRGSLLSPKRESRLHSSLGLSFPAGSASESPLSGIHEASGFLQKVSVLSVSNSRIPDLGIWAWKRISRGHEGSSDFTLLGQGLLGNGLFCSLPPASQQLPLKFTVYIHTDWPLLGGASFHKSQ